MGFHYTTGLDFNMGYLSMLLDEPLKVIITIIMPFGLFGCQLMPWRVKPVMDIFQGQMSLLFNHLRSNVPKLYLDDVLHTSGNIFNNHIKYLKATCKVLKKVGTQVSTKKSTWYATALESLSFWVTSNGYRPIKSWVEAVPPISSSSNVKQVCIFVHCINFVKNHNPQHAEILKPIGKLTKKEERFLWGQIKWEALKKIGVIIWNQSC